MKIEVGKKYITNDGTIANVISRDDSGPYPFIAIVDGTKRFYTEDGIHSKSNPANRFRIISEHLEEAQTEKASDRQTAGDHYKLLKIQPYKYALENNLNFMQSNVIKYVTRYKNKNGIEDLRKAIHCIELLIQHEEESVDSK